MEAKNERRFRILVFPWIAHGHVFPYLQLSMNLSNHNFHIYFCSTAINLDSIKNSIQEQSSIQLVELQLPSFPDLPPHLHTTKNVPPNLMPRLFKAFQLSISSFTDIITDLKPDLLIYDVFQPWAAKIASSMNIPAVHFATTGAATYSFGYHMSTHKDSTFPYPALYSKDYERKALQAEIGERKIKEADKVGSFGHFELSYDIVLMRTCRGIEGKYVDYLSVLCKKNVVPVGPLITQSENEENGSEIVDWLSKKPKFSTVFISFGSENYLSKDQMEEIAKGLELCEANFIWVVRSPVGETITINEVMPKGFLDRVKQRGIIVQGWAPQAKILAHESVGAFMSHCGMSSIIESLYFGVPVIGVPLKLDQPLNARFLVETGAAIEVERDEDGNLFGEEVANAIRKVIVEICGQLLRLRALELSEKMKNEEEGAMNEAAEQLLQLCIKFKQQN
ncbi:cyanidin-3-O-glucoside 2-O-glucuronosyltransferase-like [Dorcoceras hygrometricum]|uniref:Glycosyltransferase n=1 Tax=Dorcoceras hygrometricum TaxID=472368 RepID=A0A2Z7CUB0_9LAMI|nr:cyanidin-3-O-glucoside 2-O-glucuronosyltransferase-like [Dorcoceras hygrometricum]